MAAVYGLEFSVLRVIGQMFGVHGDDGAVVGKDYGVAVLATVEERVGIVLLPSAADVAGTVVECVCFFAVTCRQCCFGSCGAEAVGGVGILEQCYLREVERLVASERDGEPSCLRSLHFGFYL